MVSYAELSYHNSLVLRSCGAVASLAAPLRDSTAKSLARVMDGDDKSPVDKQRAQLHVAWAAKSTSCRATVTCRIGRQSPNAVARVLFRACCFLFVDSSQLG